MIEQLSVIPSSQTEQLTQYEVDARFESIVQLMELNSQLDGDLQADYAEALRAERDRLVGELMQDPVEAFQHEFALLERLYDGRTLTEVDSLGNTVSQFVTRNPSRQRADLLFRHIQYDSGSVERVVEVPRREESGLPFYISVKEGNLRLAATVYRRSRYERLEIDPTSHQGRQLLQEYFTHTIVASDLVYNRTPEEIELADRQAVRFMYAKQARDRTV